MGFRGLAGDMARNTSGLWRGIAEAVDPDGRRRSSGDDHIDLTESTPSPPVAGPTTATGDGFAEQGGRMVVPLDTWTRILEQVGNVHEAGQQLAEAKERAARAETENLFLREQLTELKAQRRPARRAASKPTPAETATPAATTPAPPAAAESRRTRARRRVSIWLSP